MDTIKPIISAYLGTVGTVSSVGSAKGTSSTSAGAVQSPTTNSDSVQFSPAAIEVAKYSSLARRIQDNVSPEQIAALKQAVSTGSYPPPLVVEGLLELVGSALASHSSQ